MVGLAVFFLIYAHFGRHFPGLLAHRGYDVVRILEQVYLGADGIYGTPLGVSATFVIIIVVLGALLELKAGHVFCKDRGRRRRGGWLLFRSPPTRRSPHRTGWRV